MKKSTCIKKIQDRLPKDIILVDETKFEFTEDEFVGILSWVKFFNEHYKEFQKDRKPYVSFPIISKRLRLDFDLYRFPCENDDNFGEYVIYISPNRSGKKNISISSLINTWDL